MNKQEFIDKLLPEGLQVTGDETILRITDLWRKVGGKHYRHIRLLDGSEFSEEMVTDIVSHYNTDRQIYMKAARKPGVLTTWHGPEDRKPDWAKP